MGAKFLDWGNEFFCLLMISELRVDDFVSMYKGITKMTAAFGSTIELIRRYIITQEITSVIGKPEFSGNRMSIEADTISDSTSEDLNPVFLINIQTRY